MTNIHEAFRNFLQEKNQHFTAQRSLILDEFLQAKTHLSVEELYGIVRKKEPSIGQVTVFRTLKLLEEAGVANPVNFGDRTIRYELSLTKEHHDHLICLQCGKVIEVLDNKLEKRQNKICQKYNFTPSHHRLEIFGTCQECK